MPGRRVPARRAASATGGASPAQGSLVLSRTSIPLTITAGASKTFEEAGETFTLSNGGPGSWANPQYSIGYSAATGWLSFSISDDGTRTFTPVVNASALSASTQTATVTFTDANVSNSGQTVTITLTVSAQQTLIVLTPTTLNTSVVDEGSGTAITTTISGVGGSLATPTVGTITYSGAFTNWITGTTVTDNGDGTFTLEVSPTGVGGTVGGPYVATVPVISSGASNTPQNLTVNLTVTSSQQALLSVTRSLDDVRGTVGGSNPADQVVGVVSANQFPLAGPTINSVTYSGTHSGWATATLVGNTLTVSTSLSGISTPGTSYVHVDITDANAANTARYSVVLVVDQPSPVPALSVSPPALGPSVTVGSNYQDQTITVTNVNGSLADLGTVTVQFTTPVSWASVAYASGVATVSYSAASLAQGSYSATLQIAATAAANSPVNVPVLLTVTAVVGGNYPVPSIPVPTTGYTWDASLGYPVGSIFNSLASYRGADNDALPTFGGTERVCTTQAQVNTALADCASGVLTDGDIITISAGLTINPLQLPVRSGWTYGTGGFIWIRTSGHASLPSYTANQGPASHTDAKRVDWATHAQYMFTSRATATGTSTLCPQQGAGGYWITGCEFANTDTSAYPYTIIDIRAHSGTTITTQNQAAHCPSMIVLDRCAIRRNATHGHIISVRADGRHISVRNCDLVWAKQENPNPSNVLECKGVLVLNTPGPVAILGTAMGAAGIGILSGGTDPNIPNVVPSDVIFAYNKVWNPSTAHLDPADGNDYKNATELKTGIRWIVFGNDYRYWPMHPQQRYCFVLKPVDQGGGNNYAAEVRDVAIWCNRLRDVTKGLVTMIDKGDFVSSTNIGLSRAECGYNLKLFAQLVQPGQAFDTSHKQDSSIYRGAGQGDGAQDIRVHHNTSQYTNGQSLLNIEETTVGANWQRVEYNNNVHVGGVQFGPVYGNAGQQDSAALDRQFGAGNWTFRRNYVYSGFPGGVWDTTLAGGNNLNKYLTVSAFTDPANGNYKLIASATDASASFPGGGGGTDGRDCGYDHDYLTAMFAGRA